MLAPTEEEAVTSPFARGHVVPPAPDHAVPDRTKFRDEIRPRSG